MAVLLKTNYGEFTIDLCIDEVPLLCANFLKLCKHKFFNNSIFHSVEKNFIARGGKHFVSEDDCSFVRYLKDVSPKAYRKIIDGEDEFWSKSEVDLKTGQLRENANPKLKHNRRGIVSMANELSNQIGSSFYITLRESIPYLDGRRSIIGVVSEGLEVLDKINETVIEDPISNKPLLPIRILHTYILDDPFPDPSKCPSPPNSPRSIVDQTVQDQDGGVESEIKAVEKISKVEARSRAVALEILGDLPDAELAPPDNVLFVCKLNPLTEAEDLELIFSRFGKVISCEIIRDWKTGDSLQYGFIQYSDSKSCEAALFKMEGALIDDRRIHVDFCQSVSSKWVAYKQSSAGKRRKKEP